MPPLRIGDVSKRAGISVEAIRYYERLGLIRQAARTASGYRKFDPDVVRRLQFIQRAQVLGFSLEEIRELLELRLTPGARNRDVRQRAEAKVAGIEARIAELQRMRAALHDLTAACCGAGTVGECPILDALEGSATRARRRS